MDFEIRAVVHYFYLNDVPADSAAAKLRDTYGEQSISKNMYNFLSKLNRHQRYAVIMGDESWLFLSYDFD